MTSSLIDDRGELWPGDSRRLREAFDSPYSGGEFVDYAIANLGFVAVDLFGRSCQVRLRPSFVGQATWLALVDWLARSPVERVVVTWLDEDWRSELLRSPKVALARLEAIVEASQGPKPGDFLARAVGATELHPKSPLGRIVRDWPLFAVPSGQHALMALLRATLGDRYVIVKREKEAGRIVFHEFGDGLFRNYETWRQCAVGAPMEEQPDRAYGRWVAGAYDEVFAVGAPTIADADVIVRWPHAGRARMRYKRIIVPLNGAGDPPMLLGGSLVDNRIDLRVGAE